MIRLLGALAIILTVSGNWAPAVVGIETAGVYGAVVSASGSSPTHIIHTLGLTDSEHTTTSGGQDSGFVSLNATGQAIGYSQRYSGLRYRGLSAWLYDAGTTTKIGLTEAYTFRVMAPSTVMSPQSTLRAR